MGEAAAKEPSMEDILASIRRIVSQDEHADDDSGVGRRPAPVDRAPPTERTVRPTFPSRTRPEPPSLARPAPGTGEPQGTMPRPGTGQVPPPTSTIARLHDPLRIGTPAPAPAAAPRAEPAPFSRTAVPLNRRAEDRPLPQGAGTQRGQSGPSAPGFATQASRPASQSPQRPLSPSPGATNTAPPMPSGPPRTPPVAAQPAPPRAAPPPSTPPTTRSAGEREVEAFRGALSSPGTQEAVRESLDRLKRSAANDLDARVEALLRPMLREWLDDNLPKLVERLVRDEIERLARER